MIDKETSPPSNLLVRPIPGKAVKETSKSYQNKKQVKTLGSRKGSQRSTRTTHVPVTTTDTTTKGPSSRAKNTSHSATATTGPSSTTKESTPPVPETIPSATSATEPSSPAKEWKYEYLSYVGSNMVTGPVCLGIFTLIITLACLDFEKNPANENVFKHLFVIVIVYFLAKNMWWKY